MSARAFLLFFALSAAVSVSQAIHCLNYLSCYNEGYVDYDQLEIHHVDLDVSTATTCLSLCLQEDANPGLVFAKVIEVNDRLVCGCGNEAALGNRSGTVNDHRCVACPDDQSQKCGGYKTVSVYEVYQTQNKCGVMKQTTTTPTTTTNSPTTSKPASSKPPYLGCFKDDSVNLASVDFVHLEDSTATLDACVTACSEKNSENDLFLTKRNDTGLHCGCGTEVVIGGVSPVPDTECEATCDVTALCGGRETYSVYGNSGWMKGASSLLLLSLVILALAV